MLTTEVWKLYLTNKEASTVLCSVVAREISKARVIYKTEHSRGFFIC